MVQEADFTMSAAFKVERSMICRAFPDEERLFAASVEVVAGVVKCCLDGSEYCFTAQQCGELADSLAIVVRTGTECAPRNDMLQCSMNLEFCKIFYHMILSRSPATKSDRLQSYGYGSSDILPGASGSFHYPGTRDYYKLFVGLDDELLLPFLAIEDWIYTFSFGEAQWLIEQLCVGGYILAQIENPQKTSNKNKRG